MLIGMSLLRIFPDIGHRTHVMGILNITPDSFSDGGRHLAPQRAVSAAGEMLASGADVLDIGGESTRPGAAPVSEVEELERVLPVIEALRRDRPDARLSIDTTKAAVARAAVAAGAAVVNDISALTFDPEMVSTVAELGVPVILSHTRGRPQVMQKGDLRYEGGVVRSVVAALTDARDRALAAGVAADDLVFDPGIGFGKTVADNLALLRRLGDLRALGGPVLVGTSRKSFLGTLTGQPVERRDPATHASVALAVAYGADFVRVHDVRGTRDAVRVADALVRQHPS